MRMPLLTTLIALAFLCCDRADKTREVPPVKLVRDTVKQTGQSRNWIDNDIRYELSPGEFLHVQNSFPRGGPYTNKQSETYGYGVFWTRMSNETGTHVEFEVALPVSQQPIPQEPDGFFQLFLPEETMEWPKQHELDYGLSNLEAVFESTVMQPKIIQKSLAPQEEFMFYTAMLFKLPDNGPVRTGIDIKDSNMFYRVSIDRYLDTVYIPCGHIAIKD